MREYERIAIITARGGSKRIPKKNIKDFCGKPIIAYSIIAALESDCFDEVMVSTDSKEIAKVAREYGASCPFLRSEKNSGDYATTSDVIDEVLREYEIREKAFYSFCCIYPTAPFITCEKIKTAYETYDKNAADAVVFVTTYDFPPQRAFVIDDTGYIKWNYPEYETTRSQDLRKTLHDCGQIYICSTNKFKERHTIIQERTIPFYVSPDEVQDIDTEDDWILAELKYIRMRLKTKGYDINKLLDALKPCGGGVF